MDPAIPDGAVTRLRVLASNAGANLAKVGASGLATLIVPVVLLATLPREDYAAWSLVFSLSLYLQYLDLGVPTSTQAVVARLAASGRRSEAASVTIAGALITMACALAAVVAAVAAAVSLGTLFPDIADGLAPRAGVALLVLVVGQGANLLANTVSGYFAGLLRTAESSRVLVPARLMSLVLACGASFVTPDLVVVAACFAVPLVAGTLILIAVLLRDAKKSRGTGEPALLAQIGSRARALLRYSGPLILWNISMFAITGVGTTIVARVDYAHIVDFSIAMIVVTAINGGFGGASAPLLPELAQRVQSLGVDRAAASAVTVARVGACILALGASLATVLLVLLGAGPLSAQLTSVAPLVLAATIAATALRQSMTPLSLFYIATRTHARVIAPPLAEAAVTAAAAIALGARYGVQGVAVGLLVGAFVGIGISAPWSIRLTGLPVRYRAPIVDIVLRPFAVATPLIVLSVVVLPVLPVSIAVVVAVAFAALTCAGMWYFALPRPVRERVLLRMRM